MESDSPDEPPLAIRRGVVALWFSVICHLLLARLNVTLKLPAALVPSSVDPAALGQGIAVLVAVIILAVALALTWLIARGIYQRHCWARIAVLTVFVLSLPFRIPWFVSQSGVNWTSLGAIAFLSLDCYVILSVFTGSGRRWFGNKPTSVNGIGAT